MTAFLSRQEAAAAFRAAADIGMKTAAREKHRLLAHAVINAAQGAPAGDPELTEWFWSLIERHSVTEVRLLAAIDDPTNRARATDADLAGMRLCGEFLFASVPELAWNFRTMTLPPGDKVPEDDYPVDEESHRRAWPFWKFLKRLQDDGLVASEELPLENELMDPRETAARGDNVCAEPFEYSTELGKDYLTFLSAAEALKAEGKSQLSGQLTSAEHEASTWVTPGRSWSIGGT